MLITDVRPRGRPFGLIFKANNDYRTHSAKLRRRQNEVVKDLADIREPRDVATKRSADIRRAGNILAEDVAELREMRNDFVIALADIR